MRAPTTAGVDARATDYAAFWRARGVTKLLLWTIIAATVIYGCSSSENVVVMAARGGDHTPLTMRLGDNWILAVPRYIAANFICLHPGELIFVSALLMTSGSLERVLSGARFLHLVCCVVGLRALVLPASLVVFRPLADVTRITPSATPLILALFCFRRCVMPPRRRFRLFGVPLSFESFHDFSVIFLLVIHNHWVEDLSGALCGLIMASSLVGLHRRRSWIEAGLERLQKTAAGLAAPSATPSTYALIVSSAAAYLAVDVQSRFRTAGELLRPASPPVPPPGSTEAPRGGRRLGGATAGGGQQPSTANIAEFLTSLEANIEFMQSMGFAAEDARAALLRNRNQVDAAVAELVGSN